MSEFGMGGEFIVFATLVGVIISEYAYNGDDNYTYTKQNLFTTPYFMISDFCDYYYAMVENENPRYVLLATRPADDSTWDFYIGSGAYYKAIKLENKCSEIILNDKDVPSSLISIYVHKNSYANQYLNGKYICVLYGTDGNELARASQIDDENSCREYVAFDFEKEIDDIYKVCFYYEDGTEALIDTTVKFIIPE